MRFFTAALWLLAIAILVGGGSIQVGTHRAEFKGLVNLDWHRK